MKILIFYVFIYFEKEYNFLINFLDLIKNNNLIFEEVDRKVLKGIDLVYRVGRIGDIMLIVFNVLNEIVVELFMKK